MAHAIPKSARRQRKRPARRRKLSTTISPETHAYLRNLVRRRTARTLAEAVDLTVSEMRRAENRARLERDTAAYFQGLSPEEAQEEAQLEDALTRHLGEIDFDA